MEVIKHGVYAKRVKQSNGNTMGVTSGIPVYIGTAPVHMTGSSMNNVNTPVICHTKEDVMKRLGYQDDFWSFTLCQAMYMHFFCDDLEDVISPVIFINVLDPAVHKKEMDMLTVPVSERIAVIPDGKVIPSTLNVQDGANKLEEEKDYLLSYENNHVLITLLASGSAANATTLAVSGEVVDTDAVTSSTVIGGYDAETGTEKGCEAIRKIYPLFGVTASVIAAPGYSHDPKVAAVLQAKCECINGTFSADCVIDLDTEKCKNFEDVGKVKEESGLISKHAYVVWPMVKKDGKILYGSAAAAAIVQRTDAANGDMPHLSPSNKAALIDEACLSDGTTVLMDLVHANTVNAYGVATFLNMEGYKLWGNYSAAYPDTSEPDEKFWSVNRFFTWKGNLFVRKYFSRIDGAGSTQFIEILVDEENMECNGYVAAGVCAGAGIEFRKEEHTVEDIMSGNIKLHISLAPYLPLQSITALMAFDINALMAEFVGGEDE